jgi:ribosome biogenesis GTPase
MGKSTIINAAAGEIRAKIGEISESLNAGKHTTTHAQLHRLGTDAWIIDSPGMKEFGVNNLAFGDLEHAFVEFRPHLGPVPVPRLRAPPGTGVRDTRGRRKRRHRRARFATFHRLRGEIAR